MCHEVPASRGLVGSVDRRMLSTICTADNYHPSAPLAVSSISTATVTTPTMAMAKHAGTYPSVGADCVLHCPRGRICTWLTETGKYPPALQVIPDHILFHQRHRHRCGSSEYSCFGGHHRWCWCIYGVEHGHTVPHGDGQTGGPR